MVGKCWHRGHNIVSVITGYSLNCLLSLAVNIVVNHNHTGDVSWFLPVKSDRSLSMVNLVLTAGCVTGVCNLNKNVTNRKGNMEIEERGKRCPYPHLLKGGNERELWDAGGRPALSWAVLLLVAHCISSCASSSSTLDVALSLDTLVGMSWWPFVVVSYFSFMTIHVAFLNVLSCHAYYLFSREVLRFCVSGNMHKKLLHRWSCL